MVPETTLIGSESVTLTGEKWLFAPTIRDKHLVELERDRLGSIRDCPSAKVTRSDAIRSLFLRAAEIDRREREAELEALPGAQIGSMVASRELEKLRGN